MNTAKRTHLRRTKIDAGDDLPCLREFIVHTRVLDGPKYGPSPRLEVWHV